MTTSRLDGQVAIVTGGASGIGAGIAASLAAQGASVVINYHSGARAENEVRDRIISAGGKAITLQADVADPKSVGELIAETLAHYSRLDIMVANAGIQVDAPFLEMTPEQWDKAMSVDLRGQFLCAQAAARQFVKQGIDEKISRAAGKIICVLSVHDKIPWAGHVNYATAKGGANMMMQSMAQELAPRRIRVVGISPGAIKTEINEHVWGDARRMSNLLTLIPYGRIGEAEDIGKVAAFLASDDADYITGTTLYVDGGMTLYPEFADNG